MAIKDSGQRREFETGAVRDCGDPSNPKGRCDLMPLGVVARMYGNEADPILDDLCLFQKTLDTEHLYRALRTFAEILGGVSTMLLEVAKHFEEGALKYGENNWQKGIPYSCYIDSAVRHYIKLSRGDTDERHDRAFVWNIMCCIWEVDYHVEN